MSFWEKLLKIGNKSLGLKGIPFLRENAERRGSENPDYWVIQVYINAGQVPSHTSEKVKSYLGQETVVIFTQKQMEGFLYRSIKMPVTRDAFLEKHSWENTTDDLLGDFYCVDRIDGVRFGTASQYWAVHLEWPTNVSFELSKARIGNKQVLPSVVDFEEADEVVLFLTSHDLSVGLDRAERNPEDVALFLREHALRDMAD